MFAAYNNRGGVQLAPDASDPFDSSNFPSSQYPYAFEVFGNNGTTPRSSQSTNLANHSLDDLINTVPNAATTYANLHLTGSGSTFTGSDHYPIVGDYDIALPPPPVLSPAILANGQFQFTVSGAVGYNYAIETATNLALSDWIPIRTNSLPFTVTNAIDSPSRFYRARLVP
jgi:hypothetical protein